MAQYYFNIHTGRVEELENKGQGQDLLGPYATRAEAERALQSAQERTEAWDRQEREWADD
ncbi:MAG: methionine aminopeptidase [Actinomycetota bacterium]